MKLLLVEDRDKLRSKYIDIIREFDPNIQVVAVSSFWELEAAMLTENFEMAILDYDLEKWDLEMSKFNDTNGSQIINQLIEYSKKRDFQAKIILYSAHQEISEEELKYKVTIRRKIGDTDPRTTFKNEILGAIAKPRQVKKAVNVSQFNELCFAKQCSFYKQILHSTNVDRRFQNLSPSLSWTSDQTPDTSNNQVIVGPVIGEEKVENHLLLSSNYQELDQCIRDEAPVPTLYWNFGKLDFLATQNELITTQRHEHQFIDLFYKLSFSHSIGNHLLHSPQRAKELLSLTDRNDMMMDREIQCSIIEQMRDQDQSPDKIKSTLNNVMNNTRNEVVDYFTGHLESFDEETDRAQVRLVSKVDPKKYFYRELRYTRLKNNGVKYKEAAFNYCVHEFNSNLISYIEPN